jgi:hypothetical protein
MRKPRASDEQRERAPHRAAWRRFVSAVDSKLSTKWVALSNDLSNRPPEPRNGDAQADRQNRSFRPDGRGRGCDMRFLRAGSWHASDQVRRKSEGASVGDQKINLHQRGKEIEPKAMAT